MLIIRDGIEIYRIPLIPRGTSSIGMVLNYVSFMLSGIIAGKIKRIKADVVFSFEVSPMTQVLTGISFAKKLKAPHYLYVQDLWPENVVTVTGISNPVVIKPIDKMVDYISFTKVLCFNGEPKLIEFHQGRFTDHQSQDYYDINWNKTDISQGEVAGFGCSDKTVPIPVCFDKMMEFSRILAKGIPQVRIDWYAINEQLYFGEITFFDGCGFDKFDNPNDDAKLGAWIDLKSL